jgi:hypothetical protein
MTLSSRRSEQTKTATCQIASRSGAGLDDDRKDAARSRHDAGLDGAVTSEASAASKKQDKFLDTLGKKRSWEQSMCRTQTATLRELDRRIGDGSEVSLLWDARTKGVSVDVTDTRQGGSFAFAVQPGDAVEAFWHPYAYVAHGDTDDLADRWSNRTDP